MHTKETESVERAVDIRWRQKLGKAGLCIVGCALAVAPSSFMYSLTQTEVKDDVATIPSTLSFAPGRSVIETGTTGTVYGNGNFTSHGIGVAIDIEQPPVGLQDTNTKDTDSLVQPFLDFYQDPKAALEGNQAALVSESKKNFISSEIIFGSILVTSVGGLLILTRELPSRRRQQLVGGFFAAATLASFMNASQLYNDWRSEYAMPEQTFPINGTEGTQIEGFSTNNPTTSQVLGSAAPFIKNQIERITAREKMFDTTAQASIGRGIEMGAFIPPDEDDRVVLLMSDLHSNAAMIDVYQYLVERINDTYGEDTLPILASAGDNTYGSASEKRFIDEMAKITDEEYVVNGNHDGQITDVNQHDAGMSVLKGKTETTSSSFISVLGDSDPSVTKPSSMIAMGSDISRDSKKPIDFKERQALEEALGDRLLEEATDTSPTFLLTHEAYSLNGIFNLDTMTQQAVYEWFDSPADPVPVDLPAELTAFGHWHPKTAKIRVILQEDGTKRAVVELGTAGGASGTNTVTHFSTPLTLPAQQASVILATVREDGKIRRLQEVLTSTDGEVEFRTPVTMNDSYAAQEQRQAANRRPKDRDKPVS
jgi:hypothetical protein